MLELRNIKKYFPIRGGVLLRTVGYIRAVDDVSLSVSEGETLGIVGESGSGKTTLGKVAIKLLEPTSGRIIYRGTDITRLRGKELKNFRSLTGIVFQDPYRSLHPRKKIIDIVSEPLLVLKGLSREEAYKRVRDFSKKIGIGEELLESYPHQLSGGQRQRAAIMRAIIYEPKIVVLDEPTSSLDVSVQAQILNLLITLKNEYNLTYIFITHNLPLAYYMSDKLAVMYLGKLVEYGDVVKIFENPLHPYTRSLLSSVPALEKFSVKEVIKKTQRIAIKGEPPSLRNPPSGCRFHPRCPYASEICRIKEPPLKEIEPNHYVACWLY